MHSRTPAPPQNKQEQLAQAIARGDQLMVELLLGAGADPDGLDGHGRSTHMCSAIQCHNEKALRALIQAGAAPNLASPLGGLPLAWAARMGADKCVKALLEAGADIEGVDADGMTPAWAAAMHGHHECLAALLAAGARVDQPDSQGRLLIHEARGPCQAMALAALEKQALGCEAAPSARVGALRV